MNIQTIIVLMIVFAAFAFAVRSVIKNGGTCGCGCKCCGECEKCCH